MNSSLVKNNRKKVKFFLYLMDTKEEGKQPEKLRNLLTGFYEPVEKNSIVLKVSSTLLDECIGTYAEELIFGILNQISIKILMSGSSIDEVNIKIERLIQKLLNNEEIMKLLTSKKPSDKELIKRFITNCK